MRLFVQEAAEEDILRQFEWYAERGLSRIAVHFLAATREAVDALTANPAIGALRHVNNPRLAGLRSWPVKGFDDFRVYYLMEPELLVVVRVLHGKRDVGAILESEEIADRPGLG